MEGSGFYIRADGKSVDGIYEATDVQFDKWANTKTEIEGGGEGKPYWDIPERWDFLKFLQSLGHKPVVVRRTEAQKKLYPEHYEEDMKNAEGE